MPTLTLSDPNNPAETERLRNLFWSAYLLDRQLQTSTGWAGNIVDEDISQELPVRAQDFEAGIDVPGPRQHLSDPDIYTNHPSHLTDGWVLMIKAYSLLGRINTFNRRLELHRHADVFNGNRPESELFYPLHYVCDNSRHKLGYDRFYNAGSSADVSSLPQFKTLDNNVVAFRLSIPSEYRNPFRTQSSHSAGHLYTSRLTSSVDGDSYMVNLTIAACVIILHGPHVDMEAAENSSRDRVLQAARTILDLIHALSATTYDPALLPRVAIPLWECATSILSVFYYHALVRDNADEAALYKSEILVFINVIGRVGEKFPLAYREKVRLLAGLDQIKDYAFQVRRYQGRGRTGQ